MSSFDVHCVCLRLDACTVHAVADAPLMGRVVAAIKEAIPHAANVEQEAMLRCYVESFDLGSIDAHKDASRHWIKDKGPAVESYIGFIESYRDPSGVRGEWEGFVSCVNREVSKKFQVLVDNAEDFLRKMPWPATFEKDQFLRPDFTSLEVLSFGSSGVPAGINIPNYDDIRQSFGFKNVSLGNVLAASYSVGDKPVSFLRQADQATFKARKAEAFEVQVGIHELLGHGSGKLFFQGTPDIQALEGVLHPVTGEPITGPFYSKGATWDSTFGKIASSYEECRAECSGLYLCGQPDVLAVFGHGAEAAAASAAVEQTTVTHTDGTTLTTITRGPISTSTVVHADGTTLSITSRDAGEEEDANGLHDIAYVNWLLMARAGLTGLEFYTPETQGWRQAHMQARYVILRVLLEAGEGLLSLVRTTGADGQPDVEVHLERSMIPTVGRKAIGEFLLKLQVHKSLADLEAGASMYGAYSEVPPEMVALRQIVMNRKEPRKLLVQPHMRADDSSSPGGVSLQTFAPTPQGMVQSFVERFPAADPELLALCRKEQAMVCDTI
jgi:dipeptidyl-peptidase-3